ncbi:MAG: thymidine phosphorylase [Pseudomonadota bacterium]|nr:thymidine phosphorylase [Pseudomonadota bacterium]
MATEVEPAPLPQELLRRKREGTELDARELTAFVHGIGDGHVADAQIGAFAMAVCLQGMSAAEGAVLTLAMRDSGEILDWTGLNGPAVDKHSTGGVGDTTSLIVAPLVAACGGFVPMLSGRGLGHSGGTLDKLESIPGYDTRPASARLQHVVRSCGLAIVGAGNSLAPADRRLYAVRDVTATVDSIPLITASILSKKLAAGLGALVLDVKFGSGAFMSDPARARALAEDMLGVARSCGLPTRVLLTDMDQPLAEAAGNALEVHAALRVLNGQDRDSRLRQLSLALAAEMLVTSELSASREQARERLDHALSSGQAAERFAHMVAELGGPADLLEHPARHLADAPLARPLFAARAGVLQHIDTRALGMAVVMLGGGRRLPDEGIDHRVGLSDIVPAGTSVDAQRPLLRIHARDEAQWQQAAAAVLAACRIGDDAPPARPLIADTLGARGDGDAARSPAGP